MERRGEDLGRRRVEDLRECHSAEQSGRRAQPTAGEKNIPNSRGESKEQKEQCQLQSETYEENNVTKKGVRPMTRNKDTESHQHIATVQELKVAEKAKEHQVEIETEIEVEKAESSRVEREVTGGVANSDRSLKKPGRLQRRKPKNEKHEMEVEIEKVAKAQKEAQSAAEVADREEQMAHNKESRKTSSRRRTRRNTSRKWKLNSRRSVKASSLS